MKGFVASIGWGVISGIISSKLGMSVGENIALTMAGVVVITAVTMK